MVGRNREKKTIRQCFLDWWLPVVALVLIVGAGRSFYLWSDRNYGQLTTSLITVFGVVLTLWMTQIRATEQLRAEGQRDRVQRSVTQRIDLAEKLANSVEHLSSENELKQAAGVQEILFQIDDWHVLIESEIAGIEEKKPEAKSRKRMLKGESLRRRQELFDIAYKFETKNVELLKSRARGLKQRLVGNDDHSLIGLDFSGMVICCPGLAEEVNFQIDLRGISAKCFAISNSVMSYVDLSYASLEKANFSGACLKGAKLPGVHLERAKLSGAHLEKTNLSDAYLEGANLLGAHLEGANLLGAHLEGADLLGAHLEGANLLGAHLQGANLNDVGLDLNALRHKKLLNCAEYDSETIFPDWLDPDEHGMWLVDRTRHES